jgi:predicted O-linked N-acetylglucosamine transferase (SPINDLY family)
MHSNLLFALAYDPGLDNGQRFEALRRWQRRHTPAKPPPVDFANRRDPERPLRVGYLSADLRSHPIAYNLEGLLDRHDRALVEPYVYSLAAMPDAVSRRLQAKVEQWRWVTGLGDRQIAERIRADSVDVLVVLAAHIGDNRPLVAAHAPAPVQVSFHDVVSSGVTAVGYWLSDWVLHPEGTDECFTERLVRLPCFYLESPPAEAPEPGPSPAATSSEVTFGSCNNPLKLNDQVVEIWARILRDVPASRLLLKYKNCFADRAVQGMFSRRFGEHGIGAERLRFVGEDLPRAQQLSLLNGVDVALDPFPFNGSTTSFEALWMGVPLVTLAGDHFVARVGASLLTALGRPEWIAADRHAYRQIALGLAAEARSQSGPRRALRHALAASPLLDAAAYARSVEQAYRAMWREWCAGRPG